MCHHKLWPISVSHPFTFLNISLGLAGGNIVVFIREMWRIARGHNIRLPRVPVTQTHTCISYNVPFLWLIFLRWLIPSIKPFIFLSVTSYIADIALVAFNLPLPSIFFCVRIYVFRVYVLTHEATYLPTVPNITRPYQKKITEYFGPSTRRVSVVF